MRGATAVCCFVNLFINLKFIFYKCDPLIGLTTKTRLCILPTSVYNVRDISSVALTTFTLICLHWLRAINKCMIVGLCNGTRLV